MWTPRTLLITDPNLGFEAHARLAPVCSDLTWLSFSVSQPESRPELLRRIAEQRWDLALSFYSDLVLDAAALASIDLPLNIHPALPRLRGMGYDLVPLAENHPSVGVTLHRMELVLDSGEIYLVHEAPMPVSATYGSLRKLNQALSVSMLDTLCRLMMDSEELDGLRSHLEDAGADVGHSWGKTYHSRKDIAALARRLGVTLGTSDDVESGWGTRIRT